MINVLIQYSIGPVGRAIEALYLNNSLPASLIVFIWMVVIFFGLRGVSQMRRLLRQWVEEVLPQYNPENIHTPARILATLEPRWNEAAVRVRFMPTKHGFWTQPATPDGLRTPVGFTPEGIDQVITRITGRKRDSMLVATDATVRPSRQKRRVYR